MLGRLPRGCGCALPNSIVWDGQCHDGTAGASTCRALPPSGGPRARPESCTRHRADFPIPLRNRSGSLQLRRRRTSRRAGGRAPMTTSFSCAAVSQAPVLEAPEKARMRASQGFV